MKNYLYFILAVFISLFSRDLFAQLPENLTTAKRAVIAYYLSGEYQKDVNRAIQEAEFYLRKRTQENKSVLHSHPLAIVLDIDDTSLSNFTANKKRDFSALPGLIKKGYREANAPAIEPVLRFYREALQSGVRVFFISLRPNEVRTVTIKNLHRSGYDHWSGIYLPHQDEMALSPQAYKTSIRKKLTKSGYDIILSIGDQDSDLQGGYAERTIKIPNPLYSF